MDIRTKTDTLPLAFTTVSATSQVAVECDINMTEKGGLKRLLNVNGSAVPTKVECFTGEAKVYGKANFRVLYVNGADELSSVEYCSDFVESIGSSEIDTTSIVSAKLSLKDIDSMAKEDSLRLQGVVDIVLERICREELTAITEVDGALTQCKDAETSMHICHIHELADVTDEYDTGCSVEKILSYETASSVSNIKVADDIVEVSGEVAVSIVYQSEGKIASKHLTLPYSEECKCFGANKNARASVRTSVQDAKLVIGGSEDDNILKIEVTICMDGEVYEYGSRSIVADVYSPCHELNIKKNSRSFDKIVGYNTSNERIGGEISIDKDLSRIVGAYAMPCPLANVTVENGRVSIDALINVSVVYVDAEERADSVVLELPATLIVNDDNVLLGDKVTVDIVIDSVTARLKREHDIDVLSEITLELRCARDTTCEVIESVDIASLRENRHKVMSVYFVKAGDTMWDVMKGIGAESDVIVSTNPNIDFDHLVGGERVLVYRGLSS